MLQEKNIPSSLLTAVVKICENKKIKLCDTASPAATISKEIDKVFRLNRIYLTYV
jgi:hypothetical protein